MARPRNGNRLRAARSCPPTVSRIESPERAGIKELIAGLMPDIPEGISIRPKLDSKDLRIIKNAMLEYMSSRGETGSASECVVLIRRILRRV